MFTSGAATILLVAAVGWAWGAVVFSSSLESYAAPSSDAILQSHAHTRQSSTIYCGVKSRAGAVEDVGESAEGGIFTGGEKTTCAVHAFLLLAWKTVHIRASKHGKRGMLWLLFGQATQEGIVRSSSHCQTLEVYTTLRKIVEKTK